MNEPVSQLGEVDFETAVSDPAIYYANPDDIVADLSLSQEQKLRFLREWAQDLADRQTADSEGMAPANVRMIETDAALVRNVNAAIAQVEEQPAPASDGPVRSLWKRIMG